MEIRGKTRELVRNFSSTDVLTKPSYQDNKVKEGGWLSTPYGLVRFKKNNLDLFAF
jgi:hypothetical protein